MASTIYHPTQLTRDLSISVGQMAPDFKLQTDTGDYWHLSQNRGRVIALLFYPKDETIICTKQMCSLRDRWREYQETGALVVGVSGDSVDEHKRFRRNHRLPIPLLADVNRKVTDIYCDNWTYPTLFTRGVVIIDQQGIVRRQDIMLRTLRPMDTSIISSIYAARAEGLKGNATTPDRKPMREYRV